MSSYNDRLREAFLKEINRAFVDHDIPDHMHEGITSYIMEGVPPGGFLRAVLRNDLYGAAHQADFWNKQRLCGYAALLEVIPMSAWGGDNAIDNWIGNGGLRHIEEGPRGG